MVSLEKKISAEEIYIRDLFGPKYLFEIPNFQRPFSWYQDKFQQLFDDIKDALRSNQERYLTKLENYEPYFLGAIILWTKELKDDNSGKYYIIDGQQRLASLAILYAVLRDLTPSEETRDFLHKGIIQEKVEDAGLEESVRILVRENDRDFFKNLVLNKGGTSNIDSVNKKDLSESKQHIVEAIETFSNGLKDEEGQLNLQLLQDYIRYLLRKVVVVVVRTSSLPSAFRLFNVVNTRGMPLTNADLLKNENLSPISVGESQHYTKIWETIEEDLDPQTIERLIGYIRSIKLKEKASKSIYEEFTEKIFKNDAGFKGKRFIEYLKTVAGIYKDKIDSPQISTPKAGEEIYYFNLMSVMKDFLPFDDWMAAVIKFREKFPEDSHLLKFLRTFERRIVTDWIRGASFTQRLLQVYRIIKLIEEKASSDDILRDPIFETEVITKCVDFEKKLDATDFYGRGSTAIPRYVLLRIEIERKDNLNKKVSYSGSVTVEHILPKTATDQYWTSRFEKLAILENTNRLGNLVLLNQSRNSAASNKPFPEKVKDYFQKRSDFDVTNELKSLDEWRPDILEARHKSLKLEAMNIWNLPLNKDAQDSVK
jgi:uncharacterized protein with ParB-like and HNH nuclease domain